MYKSLTDQAVVVAEPYLKWAGSKRQMVPTLVAPIRRYLDGTRNRFIEPFAGSAALSLAMGGQILLSDISGAIVEVHRAVRDAPDAVYGELMILAEDTTEAAFCAVRAAWNADDAASSTLRAAQMIYLNRIGFNGLWRQNRKGHFNVPYGKLQRTRESFPDRATLRAAATALRDARIEHADFRVLVGQVVRGDVCMCFVPGSRVLRADEVLVDVTEVQVGDRLWGGRTVKRCLRRHYNGKILRIDVQGVLHTPTLTEEHPVLSIPGRRPGARQDARSIDELRAAIALRPACDLRPDDYVLLPTGIGESCATRRFVGDYLAVRVRAVTAFDYVGSVFNFETDNDRLLCVDGIVSHNCDPPYYDTYDGYSGQAWTEDRRAELADRLAELARRGVVVLAFDADCEATRALYAWADVHAVTERSSISAAAGSRGERRAILAATPGFLS